MLAEVPDNMTLQKRFGQVLADILDGAITSAPEGNGLDDVVNAALNDLAENRETARAEKTLAAYNALGAQLSGIASQAAEQELLKSLGL